MSKVKISDFLSFFYPHAVMTADKAPAAPPVHQLGYTLGGDGRVADDAYLRNRARIAYPDSWESYYKRTLKWLGRPVYDCNSLAEAFYKAQTGVNIDTKAKTNYASWCSYKSPTAPDKGLAAIPQMPGVALFSGTSASSITHVGFLLHKYGSGPLDWYVLEARGADYGVVITKLAGRGWAWWGVMDKYFDYDLDNTWAPDEDAKGQPAETEPEQPSEPTESVPQLPFHAVVNGGSVHVRADRNASSTKLLTTSRGDKLLALPAVNGWCEVAVGYKGGLIQGFMSAGYVKEV